MRTLIKKLHANACHHLHHHIYRHIKPHLERQLGLISVILLGVGVTFGAGIYSLIGIASGHAGNAVWLSFVIAAVLAALTGMSYAELSSMFPKDSGEYEYIKKGINTSLAFWVAIMVLFAGVIASATLALSFADYLASIINLPILASAIGIIIFFSLINFYGIRQAVRMDIGLTVFSIGGLLVLIFIGLYKWSSTGLNSINYINYLEMPQGFNGVMAASALVFFAYLGFEEIIKFAEETKNPTKNISHGLLFALLITTILYFFVSFSAVSLVGWQGLASSKAPLAFAVSSAFGSHSGMVFLLAVILALFTIGSTLLVILIAVSRMAYGMACEGSLPEWLSLIHKKTKTPWAAILSTSFFIIFFVLISNLEIVGNLTTMTLFATFIVINLSVIILRYKRDHMYRGFRMPFNIGRFPVTALIGLLFSLVMLCYAVRNIFVAI